MLLEQGNERLCSLDSSLWRLTDERGGIWCETVAGRLAGREEATHCLFFLRCYSTCSIISNYSLTPIGRKTGI